MAAQRGRTAFVVPFQAAIFARLYRLLLNDSIVLHFVADLTLDLASSIVVAFSVSDLRFLYCGHSCVPRVAAKGMNGGWVH